MSDAPRAAQAGPSSDTPPIDGPVVTIRVDGRDLACAAHVTLAAALLNAGISGFRTSVEGYARGPVCGMGTCFECRVTVDGVAHVRACMHPVRDGMDVRTGDGGQRS